jgi:hypothetical protein
MASLDLQAQTESSLNMDHMIAGDDTIWGHIVGQEEGDGRQLGHFRPVTCKGVGLLLSVIDC